MVLFVASIGIFALVRLLPGDPASVIAGPDAPPEVVAAVRRSLGLGAPFPIQYLAWLGNLFHGNLGVSIAAKRPVADLIANSLPPTLELLVLTVLVSIALGVALGTVTAWRHGSWIDSALVGLSSVVIAIPSFWLALMSIVVFALIVQLLPPGGWVDPRQDPLGSLQASVLPVGVLALGQGTVIGRFFRAAMLEVLSLPYVQTARAKGLQERVVILRHAGRNALIPVVTVVGVQIGHLISGVVILETIFAWPGMGRLVVQAVSGRDYPVLQVVLLLLVTVFIAVNLATDILYGFLDPRLRASGGRNR